MSDSGSSVSVTQDSDKENAMEIVEEEEVNPYAKKLEEATRRDLYDPNQDKEKKRWLRQEYRNLITVTEENRQEYLRSNSDGLSNTISKANVLYKNVRNTHEATLDSRVLVLSGDLGVQKARLLKLDHDAFDTDDFISKLLTFMGGHQMMEEEDEHLNLNWDDLGKVAARFTNRATTMDFILGPLSVEQKERTKGKAPIHIEKNIKDLRKPKEVKEEDIDRQENETTKNVLKIGELVREKGPINLFEFIINPNSFGQTVENLFYLSFLIRDGLVYIDDEDGQPILTRCEPPSPEDIQAGLIKKQIVLEMDMDLWRSLIKVYGIRESIIPTRVKKEQATDKWYG